MITLKRELTEIEKDFNELLEREKPSYKRNKYLIELLNELEHDYHTFILNPSPEEMATQEIILYQKIGSARI